MIMNIYVIKKGRTNNIWFYQCIHDFAVFAWGRNLADDYIVIVSTKKGDIIVPTRMIGGDLNRLEQFLYFCS